MGKSYPAVIKWFGSKRTAAKQLSSQFPICNTYYEPFVGGGAMMPYSKAKGGVAGDIIPELIELWAAIKEKPQDVSNEYKMRWEKLQVEGADVYYEVRDSFNKTKNIFDFLFITRTCVNGMIRYNSQGEFNNSFHLSRPGIDPQRLEKIINQWSAAIQKFEFRNTDYRETLKNVQEGDFVFLDPPYGGTKDRYTHSEFNLDDFYDELKRLNQIGAKWMLTFDGSAGEREYNFAPPAETYQNRFYINTGNSAFSKLMENKSEIIQESVYTNYKIRHNSLDLFQDL